MQVSQQKTSQLIQDLKIQFKSDLKKFNIYITSKQLPHIQASLQQVNINLTALGHETTTYPLPIIIKYNSKSVQAFKNNLYKWNLKNPNARLLVSINYQHSVI